MPLISKIVCESSYSQVFNCLNTIKFVEKFNPISRPAKAALQLKQPVQLSFQTHPTIA